MVDAMPPDGWLYVLAAVVGIVAVGGLITIVVAINRRSGRAPAAAASPQCLRVNIDDDDDDGRLSRPIVPSRALADDVDDEDDDEEADDALTDAEIEELVDGIWQRACSDAVSNYRATHPSKPDPDDHFRGETQRRDDLDARISSWRTYLDNMEAEMDSAIEARQRADVDDEDDEEIGEGIRRAQRKYDSGYSGCGWMLLMIAFIFLFVPYTTSDGSRRTTRIAEMFSTPAPTESPYENERAVLDMGAFFTNSDFLLYGYRADTGFDEATIHYDISNWSGEVATEDGFSLDVAMFLDEAISSSGHSYDFLECRLEAHLDEPRAITEIRITAGDYWVEYECSPDRSYDIYELEVSGSDRAFFKALGDSSEVSVRLTDTNGERHRFNITEANRQMLADAYVLCVQYGFFD